MSIPVLTHLLVLVSAAFVGGALLKYLKQPPVIGYLLAGVVLGAIWTTQAGETVEFLAELGVVLLLFALGLEFSFSRLKKVARIAVIGGVIQILLTWLVMGVAIALFGIEAYAAFFMAAAFSLSSTAVVVKLLVDRGEFDTLPGEIMVAWLLVQDLAVLPMIVLLPGIGKVVLAQNGTLVALARLGQQLSIASLLLIAVLFIGKQIIPRTLDYIARLNSRELLLVGVFGIAIVGGLLTQQLGLSAALGAFLAGILISESAQRHAMFAEIRPLRDIFSLLFFASLGLILPSGFLFEHLGVIFGLTALVMVVKFFIVMAATLYLGSHAKTSFIVGLGLVEVGEFAFILARVGLTESVIDTTTYAYILSVALLSILIMPPLYLAAPELYLRIRETARVKFRPLYTKFFLRAEHRDTLEELPYKNHVVLCGYGRVGKYIGRALTMADIQFIVIEYHHEKALKLRMQGIVVVYGDPSDRDILDYAQVDRARAVVIAIPDLHTQRQVIAHSLTLNKNIDIYCRTHYESHQSILKALGVGAVIQPEFEAALSIAHKILKNRGIKQSEISGKLARLKIEHGME